MGEGPARTCVQCGGLKPPSGYCPNCDTPEETTEPSGEPTPSDDGGRRYWRDLLGLIAAAVTGLAGLHLLEASQTSAIPLITGIILIMLAPKAHEVIYNG